jgi:hypothetical protein
MPTQSQQKKTAKTQALALAKKHGRRRILSDSEDEYYESVQGIDPIKKASTLLPTSPASESPNTSANSDLLELSYTHSGDPKSESESTDIDLNKTNNQHSPLTCGTHAGQGMSITLTSNDSPKQVIHTPDSTGVKIPNMSPLKSATTLDTINENIMKLSSVVYSVQNELNLVRNTQTEQEKKLDKIEARIMRKNESMHEKILQKLTVADSNLAKQKETTDTNTEDIVKLKEALNKQHADIANLTQAIKKTYDEYKDDTQKHEEAIGILETELKDARKEALDAKLHANSIEAHSRRWAVRIVGLPAPESGTELKEDAKYLVADFLNDVMEIHDIYIADIDCAHRVGTVTKEKTQMMLVRFHACDDAEKHCEMQQTIICGPLFNVMTHLISPSMLQTFIMRNSLSSYI